MADVTTTNLEFTLPEVTASDDTWGTKLNANWAIVDAMFNTSDALLVANGGTGAVTASAARTALGLAIGSDVQAYSAALAGTTASFLIADETKLDGIEALADVTDATNIAAAGGLVTTDLGVTVQGYDADLAAIAALVGTSGLLKKTATDTWVLDTATYLTGTVDPADCSFMDFDIVIPIVDGDNVDGFDLSVTRNSKFAFTINTCTHYQASGNGTFSVQIEGVNVTGLAAVNPSTTETETTATAANTVAAGDNVHIEFVNFAGDGRTDIVLHCTRTS